MRVQFRGGQFSGGGQFTFYKSQNLRIKELLEGEKL